MNETYRPRHPRTEARIRRLRARQPQVFWPDDAKAVVSLCINQEEGSEYSKVAGDGRNEGLAEIPYSMDPPSTETSRRNRCTNTAVAQVSGGCCASSTSTTSKTTFYAPQSPSSATRRLVSGFRGRATSLAATAGVGRSTGYSSREQEREHIELDHRSRSRRRSVSVRSAGTRIRPEREHERVARRRGRVRLRLRCLQRRSAVLHGRRRHAASRRSVHHGLQRCAATFFLKGFGGPSDFFDVLQSRARQAARKAMPAIRR